MTSRNIRVTAKSGVTVEDVSPSFSFHFRNESSIIAVVSDIFAKFSSVSAAAALLLGSGRSDASVEKSRLLEFTPNVEGKPVEPLILKPPRVREMTPKQFAGHRSHSSHVSGKGRGGGGSYYPPSTPVATPTPLPTATPRITYVPSPTPKPIPTATPLSVVNIELANGALLYGAVIVKSAAGITFKPITEDRIYKIPRILLAEKTIKELQLTPEEAQSK